MNPELGQQMENEQILSPQEKGHKYLARKNEELMQFIDIADKINFDSLGIESDLPQVQKESLAILAYYEEIVRHEGRANAEN